MAKGQNNLYEGFSISWKVLAGGLVLAAGGICKPGRGEDCKAALKTLPQKVTGLEGCSDPVKVDLALAEAGADLTKSIGDELYALGLSIGIPGIHYPCGGIIGSPGGPPSSADERIDNLGYGLFCYARSGGPGAVIACAEEAAADIFARVEETAAGAGWYDQRKAWKKMQAIFVSSGIAAWFLVSDGCGPGAECRLAYFTGDEVYEESMEAL
jgi:hypothetical protein